jgi:hypothetical protein
MLYGLITEGLFFLGGLFVLTRMASLHLWDIILSLLWQTGLLVLIVIDVKKIRLS